uniref:Uncharacterized protein n=1 Tax=Rhizophora mucronata TaxID=61149 RepID=A0A2P2N4R9_RHIMU
MKFLHCFWGGVKKNRKRSFSNCISQVGFPSAFCCFFICLINASLMLGRLHDKEFASPIFLSLSK